MFRQYVNAGEVHPCVIVDDLSRTGDALLQTVELVNDLGAQVIGCGVIVRFTSSPDRLATKDGEEVPIHSLVEFEAKWYNGGEHCEECTKDVQPEHVRF